MGGCERCGRLDSTLRGSTFTYTISVILMTFRRGAGGIYCGSCRKKEGLKYTLISALFGWWGFPWGPIYTLQAIGRNSAGGLQDRELNAQILQAVAAELIERGDKDASIAALEESLRLNDDGDVRRALWSLKGELAGDSTPALLGSSVSPHSASPGLTVFVPGALVRTANGSAQLYERPDNSAEPVATLNSETAVVTRVEPGWVELQVPGGSSGWVDPETIELA